MLFYVISDPLVSYNNLLDRLFEIKEWVNKQKGNKKMLSMYQKVDKGSVILLEVESNEELNQILAEWMKIINCPVKFEIIPVIVPKVLE